VTRRLILAALTLLIAGALVWQFRHEKPRPNAQKTGDKDGAPTAHFSLRGLDGTEINSANYKGKVVLVDFWATWCVPCEAEIPQFVDWQKRYAGDGLQVVGFSMDDTISPVKAYAVKHSIQYPIAMADDKTIAAFGGVLGLPVNILIGRDGRVLTKHVGVTDIAGLQKEVEQALATK
jgi:cytochrome c biogenesis protein CcmG/thiol:disulfide interchange protein DsbE